VVQKQRPALQLVTAEAGTQSTEPATRVELVALLGRIGHHDESAFESFYSATVDQVFGLVARIVGSGPDAEEVTEDVYLYVWHNHQRYQADKGHPLAWLFTLARSRAIDRYRYHAKHERLADAVTHEPTIESSTPDVSSLYSGTRLHRCIDALPLVQRQIISLAYFRGLTHSEIANSLDMSLGTVKTHIRRTLIALREEVEA